MTEISEDQDLQELQQQLMAAVCHDATTRLQIYQRGLRLNFRVYESKRRPSKVTIRKPSMPSLCAGEEYDDEQSKNMPSPKVLNAIKLDKDLDNIIRLYELASDELVKGALNTAVTNLQVAIASRKDDSSEAERQIQLLRTQRQRLKSLKAQLATNKQQAEERLRRQEERIADLCHQRGNVRRINELEFDLVERWEQNRLTQATILGQNEERALMRRILEYSRLLAGEQRIIAEVQSYSDKQFAEFRNRIADWQSKYAVEIAKKKEEIQEQERLILALSKTHERHQLAYEQRVQFVAEYRAQKAEQQRILDEQRLRLDSAVRLQAWWRGMMVRRGLGPFKKKMKKGKKGKGKK